MLFGPTDMYSGKGQEGEIWEPRVFDAYHSIV